jgi:hypothetical protein
VEGAQEATGEVRVEVAEAASRELTLRVHPAHEVAAACRSSKKQPIAWKALLDI